MLTENNSFDLSVVRADYKVEVTNPFSVKDLERDGRVSEKDFDFDLFLEGYSCCIQRPFCWSSDQQAEFIKSIVYRNYRMIPPVACLIDDSADRKKYRVVDGKQRLKSIFEWVKGSLGISLEGYSFTIKNCPENLKGWIGSYRIPVATAYDMSDKDILDWFLRINYAGTPQDEQHLSMLSNLKN